ncbi:non-canonical purine NTP diphosphatase [Olivibacter sp. SDN3]|uniref:non-canonical purine NTP diphosphatase n=1 Tax=Olivibacter sp. SDN3 TaxID=2764720 RepID=UPI0016518219|nr:non-canonical purine NTP diphosphatase [Olivibacter sp. SDN3]QNL51270.1 non-canonical purine NTP diphosphatase [Olivibacter sp. SDN3]
MNKLVFATNNQHKLSEVQAMVGKLFTISSLADMDIIEDIPETADTFEGNASQKSAYILHHYQLDCFADDSGLEVEALQNEPGVFSARYSGTRNMEANIDLLLSRLGNNMNRNARFRTVISLRIDGEHHLFEGTINGIITDERIGIEGFGYDPIFIPNGYDKTFAEMAPEEKNSISHRAIATAKLVSFLKDRNNI